MHSSLWAIVSIDPYDPYDLYDPYDCFSRLTTNDSSPMPPKKRAEREVSAGGIVFRRDADGTPRFLLICDSYRHWGFPKGHLEDGESPAVAAMRETREETGLEQLILQGPIRVIDWHFRFRGHYIHKFCHFFLFESPEGDAVPQVEEGITATRWEPLEQALEVLSYDNARGVLRRGAEMARALVAVGAGRARPRPSPITPRAN